MGRRSDHSREELEALILDEGQRLLAEVGFARFSAREVARRIGYSVGTVANVFGSVDGLVSAINANTFALWSTRIETMLTEVRGAERIDRLVRGYFTFASENFNLWSAIYEHRLPADMPVPAPLARERTALTAIIAREVSAVLPENQRSNAPSLSRSLIATVHGHCAFALNGTFALLDEQDPLGLALSRVGEILQAHGARLGNASP